MGSFRVDEDEPALESSDSKGLYVVHLFGPGRVVFDVEPRAVVARQENALVVQVFLIIATFGEEKVVGARNSVRTLQIVGRADRFGPVEHRLLPEQSLRARRAR